MSKPQRIPRKANINLLLSQDLLDALNQACEEDNHATGSDCSRSEMVRRILHAHLINRVGR